MHASGTLPGQESLGEHHGAIVGTFSVFGGAGILLATSLGGSICDAIGLELPFLTTRAPSGLLGLPIYRTRQGQRPVQARTTGLTEDSAAPVIVTVAGDGAGLLAWRSARIAENGHGEGLRLVGKEIDPSGIAFWAKSGETSRCAQVIVVNFLGISLTA